MRFDLNFHSGIPIYIQLKEQIKYGIASGQLQPGTQLPTVRQLAVDLRINANTVSRVYSELEHEGLLATRKGKGTFVLENAPAHKKADIKQLEEKIENCIEQALHLGFAPDEISSVLQTWANRVADKHSQKGGN